MQIADDSLLQWPPEHDVIYLCPVTAEVEREVVTARLTQFVHTYIGDAATRSVSQATYNRLLAMRDDIIRSMADDDE